MNKSLISNLDQRSSIISILILLIILIILILNQEKISNNLFKILLLFIVTILIFLTGFIFFSKHMQNILNNKIVKGGGFINKYNINNDIDLVLYNIKSINEFSTLKTQNDFIKVLNILEDYKNDESDKIHEYINSMNLYILIIKYKNEVVGCRFLNINLKKKNVFAFNFTINKSLRGKGIGGDVMKSTFIKILKPMGINILKGDIKRNNPTLIDFHIKNFGAEISLEKSTKDNIRYYENVNKTIEYINSDYSLDKFKFRFNELRKIYTKFYLGTTDTYKSLTYGILKPLKNFKENINYYFGVGGSFLFPLAYIDTSSIEEFCFFDYNPIMLHIYKCIVEIIKFSDTRENFLENIFCRKLNINKKFQQKDFYIKNLEISKWLEIPYDKNIFDEVINKLDILCKDDTIKYTYQYIFLKYAITKHNRQVLPTWSKYQNHYNNIYMKSKIDNPNFYSSFYYDICGFLLNDNVYKKIRNLLITKPIKYTIININNPKYLLKYNLDKNFFIFITNIDSPSKVYSSTVVVAKALQKILNNHNGTIFLNSVITGLHIIKSKNIYYNKEGINYIKKKSFKDK